MSGSGVVKSGNVGFTLLELMATLAVMLILLGLGLPSYQQQRQAHQLLAAADGLYGHIQLARNEARARQDPAINIYFFAGNRWCYRITDRSDRECDSCSAICDIGQDGLLRGANWSDYPDVTLQEIAYTGDELGIGIRRGTLGAGHVTFASGAMQVSVKTSGLGRIRLCSVDASLAGVWPCA